MLNCVIAIVITKYVDPSIFLFLLKYVPKYLPTFRYWSYGYLATVWQWLVFYILSKSIIIQTQNEKGIRNTWWQCLSDCPNLIVPQYPSSLSTYLRIYNYNMKSNLHLTKRTIFSQFTVIKTLSVRDKNGFTYLPNCLLYRWFVWEKEA